MLLDVTEIDDYIIFRKASIFCPLEQMASRISRCTLTSLHNFMLLGECTINGALQEPTHFMYFMLVLLMGLVKYDTA